MPRKFPSRYLADPAAWGRTPNTKRVPDWEITERAIDYYRRMRALDPDSDAWWQLHDHLRAELHAPPWIFPLTNDAALVAALEAAVAERAIR